MNASEILKFTVQNADVFPVEVSRILLDGAESLFMHKLKEARYKIGPPSLFGFNDDVILHLERKKKLSAVKELQNHNPDLSLIEAKKMIEDYMMGRWGKTHFS